MNKHVSLHFYQSFINKVSSCDLIIALIFIQHGIKMGFKEILIYHCKRFKFFVPFVFLPDLDFPLLENKCSTIYK